jgi:hypothetical protein
MQNSRKTVKEFMNLFTVFMEKESECWDGLISLIREGAILNIEALVTGLEKWGQNRNPAQNAQHQISGSITSSQWCCLYRMLHSLMLTDVVLSDIMLKIRIPEKYLVLLHCQ